MENSTSPHLAAISPWCSWRALQQKRKCSQGRDRLWSWGQPCSAWQEVRILTTGPRLPCLIWDMSGDGPMGPIDPRGPGCPGGPGDPGTPWLPFGPGAPTINSKGYLPGKAFRTLHQREQWGLTIFWTTQWACCLNTPKSTNPQQHKQHSSHLRHYSLSQWVQEIFMKQLNFVCSNETKISTAKQFGTQTRGEKKSRKASFSHKEKKGERTNHIWETSHKKKASENSWKCWIKAIYMTGTEANPFHLWFEPLCFPGQQPTY